jgi:hypothetical protein
VAGSGTNSPVVTHICTHADAHTLVSCNASDVLRCYRIQACVQVRVCKSASLLCCWYHCQPQFKLPCPTGTLLGADRRCCCWGHACSKHGCRLLLLCCLKSRALPASMLALPANEDMPHGPLSCSDMAPLLLLPWRQHACMQACLVCGTRGATCPGGACHAVIWRRCCCCHDGSMPACKLALFVAQEVPHAPGALAMQ